MLTLKALHILALAAGLGLGLANLVIGAMSADPAITRPIQKRLSRVAFAALIVLWITSVWMAVIAYTLSTLPFWFWVKILVVLAMTAAAVTAQVALIRAPDPETPARLKRLTHIVTGSAALAVILAVIAFG